MLCRHAKVHSNLALRLLNPVRPNAVDLRRPDLETVRRRRALMKPLTEWASHWKAFINSGSMAPLARDNSFTAPSRIVVLAFEAFLGLGCFCLRVALSFCATLGLSG
jgi:hypothetical protein